MVFGTLNEPKSGRAASLDRLTQAKSLVSYRRSSRVGPNWLTPTNRVDSVETPNVTIFLFLGASSNFLFGSSVG